MIRLTTNILKQFSRSQNFFSQNPIYPDFGEKEFDIYNGERKKIDVLDIYGKRKTHKEMVRSQIRKHFMMPKSAKRKSNSYIKGSEVRDQNEFVLGIHEDFDNFAQEFKKRRAADASAKSDFLKAVDMLIKKYKMKNIIELIKIFRIGIAF